MNFGVIDNQGRRKYLNKRECLRFAETVSLLDDEHERFLCELLLFTGCRLSEALSLTGENLDVEDKLLRVKTLKKRGLIIYRRIPIPTPLVEGLQALGEANKSNCDKLWNISRTTAWRLVKKVMGQAQIEGVHACPKGLRHAFGVRCALAGVPVTKIQNWMGHADVKTTSIYLDVRDAEDRELMSRTWLKKPKNR